MLQTCHVHLSRDYLFTTLARLGLNFANVMHLGVRLSWAADFAGFKARHPYVYHARLKACVRMGERRVALDFSTHVNTLSGLLAGDLNPHATQHWLARRLGGASCTMPSGNCWSRPR